MIKMIILMWHEPCHQDRFNVNLFKKNLHYFSTWKYFSCVFVKLTKIQSESNLLFFAQIGTFLDGLAQKVCMPINSSFLQLSCPFSCKHFVSYLNRSLIHLMLPQKSKCINSILASKYLNSINFGTLTYTARWTMKMFLKRKCIFRERVLSYDSVNVLTGKLITVIITLACLHAAWNFVIS